jgi:hypothetical protein
MATVDSFRVQRNVPVPMRDGVMLRADLWLPERTGPAAAILFRSPYGKSRTADVLKAQDCVEGGFAAIVQDTRGRFESEGNWKPGMWDEEAVDTYDTVEWVAAQSWCSGAVGMAGQSYLGGVQLVGAALRPPHLKAIAPTMITAGHLARQEAGGALLLDMLVSWTAFMALDWMQRESAAGRPLAPEDVQYIVKAAQNPRKLMDFRPLRDLGLFKIPGFPISFEQATAAFGIPDLDWGKLDLPILFVGGWYDLFCGGTVGAFQKLRSENPGRKDQYHLLMGCWTHAASLPMYHGQVNFGLFADGRIARVFEQQLRFFRKYLCGDNLALPTARYFVMNANEWRDVADWPLADIGSQRLCLHSDGHAVTTGGDGRLDSIQPTADEPADRFVYDPADPTPTVGGRVLYVGGLAMGPIDQRPLEHRSDVLCYTGPETDEAFDILGPVRARLHVASSAPDTDFVAKLIDVAPDGVALPVCEGLLRMRWRNGADRPAPPLRSGDVECISIDCAHVAWRVHAGHRLRLQIQSANYPHIDPNMNTGNLPGADASGTAATNSVFHDVHRPSWVELHMAPSK